MPLKLVITYPSVPYEDIKEKADVRVTRNVIEVFYHNDPSMFTPDYTVVTVNTVPMKYPQEVY